MTAPLPGRAPVAGTRRDRVVVSGASGLIGAAVASSFRRDGHDVAELRRASSAGRGDSDAVRWDPGAGTIDAGALDGVDVVVHLAGEPIAQRWTAGRKARIRESRVAGTRLLASAIAALPRPPRVVLSGSAIGIYGDRGDELLDERSGIGTDWLARVGADWEAATSPLVDAGVRVVLLRTGIVLSRKGGALQRMLPPFQAGVGGRLGTGEQWMSWITLQDVVRAIRFVADADAIAGPVDLTAPNAVRNAEFTRALGRVLRRPALIPVPAFALTLAFGEMARATILASQRVRPTVLRDSGFEFQSATVEQGLRVAIEAPDAG